MMISLLAIMMMKSMMMVWVFVMILVMTMLMMLVMLVTLFLATQLFQSASISALLGKEISPSINCDVIIIIPILTKIKGNTKIKKCETLTIQRAQTSNMVYV